MVLFQCVLQKDDEEMREVMEKLNGVLSQLEDKMPENKKRNVRLHILSVSAFI